MPCNASAVRVRVHQCCDVYRRVPRSLLPHAVVRRNTALLHGTCPRTVSSTRRHRYLEDRSSLSRYNTLTPASLRSTAAVRTRTSGVVTMQTLMLFQGAPPTACACWSPHWTLRCAPVIDIVVSFSQFSWKTCKCNSEQNQVNYAPCGFRCYFGIFSVALRSAVFLRFLLFLI